MSANMLNAVRAATRRTPFQSGMTFASRFYSSSVHGHDPNTLETEKRRNLSGQQHKTSTPHEQNAPGWNEYLASASEAAVKADQSPDDGGPSSPAALQEKTVTHIKRRYHAEEFTEPKSTEQSLGTEQGTNTSRMAHGESVHAVYEREEISGPLGAGTEETVEKEVTSYNPAKPTK